MRYKAFCWGNNDCLTFAGGVIKAQLGTNLVADWAGNYTTRWGCFLNYKRKLSKLGYDDIIDAMDKRFVRAKTLLPARGSLVLRPQDDSVMGFVFGVCISEYVVFLGAKGLEFSQTTEKDMFWSVEQ